MSKINILSPLLADMIAAGEVVERPASVIKELCENSFDAGASKVTVEFRGGGATYIRITDDGCGMPPDDAGLAFTRHATSKLSSAEGLAAIGTMGFRGEALAAVSAVSRIELYTREKGADEGIFVGVEAGDITDMHAVGCPEGTSITVRDIFYNTPARLKFLKSDRSEAGACIAAALRCALSRPDISVRCIRDGQEEFFTPGDGSAESAVYSLLGRELANGMLAVSGESEGITVNGFASSPAAGRGTRAMQYFFVNGRHIKSTLLQSALEQSYKNTLLTGKFPACVLYLSVKKNAVDVNVHPAKTEVRFSDEKRVFDAVYQTVKAALEAESEPLRIKLSEGTRKAVSVPKQDFYRTVSAEDFRREQSEKPHSAPALSASASSYGQRQEKVPALPRSAVIPKAPAKHEPLPVQSELKPVAEPQCRVIGEALNTYILAELDDELILIDKHAAHERMIFDRLKAENRGIMSQTLLVPIIIKPAPEDAEIIETRTEDLSRLGFEIDAFGADAMAIRAIPDSIEVSEAASAVEELCRKMREGAAAETLSQRDELLHTVACKAAIKAGKRSGLPELQRIANEVVSGRVRYCPHGRPVSVRLAKNELDKFFSRIV